MIRVKLVIIKSSDGNIVNRLINTRICSDKDSDLPSPDTDAMARSKGCPDWAMTGSDINTSNRVATASATILGMKIALVALAE